MPTREPTELDQAVAAYRDGQGPEQPMLAVLSEDEGIAADIARGKGRPAGSRNLRSEQHAAELMRRHGDPLEEAVKVAAIDILDDRNIETLARKWGCKRHEAAKLWAQINRDVQPYLHQQLPRAVVVNPGAPGGDRVELDLGDGDYIQIRTREAAE